MSLIGKLWNGAKERASNAADTAENKAQQAWNTAVDTAKGPVNTVTEKVQQGAGVAATVANGMQHVASNLVKSGLYSAGYAYREAPALIQSAKSNIASGANEAATYLINAAANPQQTLRTSATNASEFGSSMATAVERGPEVIANAVTHPREALADADQHIPDAVPFNNVISASAQELAGDNTITLDDGAFNEIKNDPAFVAREQSIVEQVQSMDGYGERELNIPFSELDGIDGSLELGGKRGQTSMIDQAKNGYNISDPEIRATWKVGGNELTWLLRHAEVDGTVHVDAKGNISIEYHVADVLDLRPNRSEGGDGNAYNAITEVMGNIWHDKLGATEAKVTGSFETNPVTGK